MTQPAVNVLSVFGLDAFPPGWSTVRVGDLLAEDRGISVGVMYPGSNDPNGIPLIRAADLSENRINLRPTFRISREKHFEYRRTALEGGELLLSLVGDIGQCAVVPKSLAGWNVARAIAVLRFKDAEMPKYVRLALLSPALKHIIRAWATTTVQATLNLKEIKQLPLPWPPLNERQRAVEIIELIENKLEVNRCMNQTLEAITAAIFKSWFVDFDPVRAKTADTSLNSELTKLFPSMFVETELGTAPCGWKLTTLGTLCRRVAMGPFGSDIKTDNFVDSGVPVVRGANLKTGFVDKGFVYLTNDKADELRHANAYPDDIVITHRGTLGQVGIIPRESRFPRYVVSQSQLVLSVNSDLATPRFVFEFLRSADGQHQLLSNTSQTGVPAIARPTTAVKAMRLIVPPIELLTKFQSLIEPLAAKQITNDHQSRTLVSIRDTILPKLMSGEIRVKTAEKIVEANA